MLCTEFIQIWSPYSNLTCQCGSECPEMLSHCLPNRGRYYPTAERWKTCCLLMNASLNWITGLSAVSYVMLWWTDLSISVAAAAVTPDLLFMFFICAVSQRANLFFFSAVYTISHHHLNSASFSSVPPLFNHAIQPKVFCFLVFLFFFF